MTQASWLTNTVTLSILALGALACDAREPAGKLVQLDSIVLKESPPALVLHRPNRIYLADNGEIVISDFTSASVLTFGSDGAVVNRIGHAGKGPGEFVTPAMVATLDTVVLVYDVSQRSAQLFTSGGAYLGIRFDVPFIANDIAIDSQSVWTLGISFESPWTVLRWNRETGALDWLIRKPALWAELPLLGSLGGAHAAFGPKATWMVFSGIDQALRWTGSLSEYPDTFAIPRIARRGVPMDLVRGSDPQALADLFNKASGTADLSVLPNGGVAVLHKDLEVHGKSRSGRYFVTVLDSLGAATCVDLEVPLPDGYAPVTRLRGDTLAVLEQIVPDSGEPRTMVRLWRIPTLPCAPGPSESR